VRFGFILGRREVVSGEIEGGESSGVVRGESFGDVQDVGVLEVTEKRGRSGDLEHWRRM